MISERLKRAIDLSRSGQKLLARDALIEIIQSEPLDEIAWFWLLDTYATDVVRLEKLQDYLKINPHSVKARQVERFLNSRIAHSKAQAIITRQSSTPPTEITSPPQPGDSATNPQETSPRSIASMRRPPRAAPTYSNLAPWHNAGTNESSLETATAIPASLSSNKRQNFLRSITRRLLSSLSILLVIAFLTQAGTYLAQMGKDGIPTNAADTFWNSIQQTLTYLFNHPANYPWHKESIPAIKLTLTLLGNSVGLLLFSLLLATLLGGLLGVAMALMRKRHVAPIMLILSILGISTPSFLFAMLLWVLNIRLYHFLGLRSAPFPPTGFGWDAHLVMPALVLAARPLAQIMQVTYIHLAEQMDSDYIRAAKARGVSNFLQLMRHAFPNILIPTLTTLGTSLRFSLSSLPIVESFFLWNGIGLGLLQAISLEMAPLITDMLVSLGFLFLLFNIGLELIYPLIDPRLRGDDQIENEDARSSWNEQRYALREMVVDTWQAIKAPIVRIISSKKTTPQPEKKTALNTGRGQLSAVVSGGEAPYASGKSFTLRHIFFNLPLLAGSALVFVFIILAVAGGTYTRANPYETHGVMTIEGQIQAPPFAPSSIFPWGSDPIGRDIQALILAGAGQTLSLAVFGMLARVILGVIVGMLAGWWQNSWFDRLINNLIAVWAAFPATLFAMILILGLGIQRGINVFVIAICIVGWSEIAQYMRSQVIGYKPKLFIEAARSVGANPIHILARHILPHLLPTILVYCALEMGAVMMLLAELGYLNIFLGGGFNAMIAEAANMVPINYYFSDVPEWGALLSNIRNWWRSYPWLAWYPGIFFFLAIFAFNLWGEGLRLFFEDSKINLRWIFSRYTLLAVGSAALIAAIMFHTTTPLRLYRSQAELFSARRALADINMLASPQIQGREAGTQGEKLAAEYIAGRMAEIGLFPAGDKNTYLQTRSVNRYHLTDIPVMQVLDDKGDPLGGLTYRQDFVEYVSTPPHFGDGRGRVVGLMIGAGSDKQINQGGLKEVDLSDKVVIVRPEDVPFLQNKTCAGMLVVGEGSTFLQKKLLYPKIGSFGSNKNFPAMEITSPVAEALLSSANSSISQMSEIAGTLAPNHVATTAEGVLLNLSVPVVNGYEDEKTFNVIGYIPGNTAGMTGLGGLALDEQVIMISAYYDGDGIAPDGTIYPGANDNASSVAAMLEMARIFHDGPYPPDKTVVFVAWSSGEHQESLGVSNAMNAKTGFSFLTVEAVIELSGIGSGDGSAIAVGQGSSYRLLSLYEDAAGRLGIPVTTRGRNPHFGRSVLSDIAERKAMSIYLSWDGSDRLADTVLDVPAAIDLETLTKVGQVTTLFATVLSREVDY